jgi:NADP-dependent 3-hydroxy acid dehydrogenase YdfG
MNEPSTSAMSPANPTNPLHAGLAGKRALVTGASSGAGEAIAVALARAGVRVALVARRKERLDALAARIVAEGGTAVVLPADVASTAEAVAAVEAARAAFGRLDILVNDAGVMLNSPLAEARLADVERMIATNLTGLVAACHAAFPAMVSQGGGDIVNISSIAGRLANPTSSVYAATKAAVSTFSESLRKEGARHGVRVSVIEPGLVATELGDHIPNPAAKERFDRMTTLWTPLQPQDLADAVLFVVSRPASAAINTIVIRPSQQDL